MKKVAAIYTTFTLVEPLRKLFRLLLPKVELYNIVDDSLIVEIMDKGKVTPNISKRLITYYQSGVAAGADIILNTCSSVSEVVDKARKKIKVPVLKMDRPMAEVAVNSSERIGVLATVETTLKPTVGLIRSIAKEQQKKVTVIEGLAKWAFESLEEGDKEEHDAILMKTARQLAKKVEILVLAQGAMAHMERTIAETIKKPVLSSPRLGVLAIKKYLK